MLTTNVILKETTIKIFDINEFKKRQQKRFCITHGVILFTFILLIAYSIMHRESNENLWRDFFFGSGLILLAVSSAAIFVSTIKVFNKMPSDKENMKLLYKKVEDNEALEPLEKLSYASEVVMRSTLRCYLIILPIAGILLTISQKLF